MTIEKDDSQLVTAIIADKFYVNFLEWGFVEHMEVLVI